MIASCYTVTPEGKVIAVEEAGSGQPVPLETVLDAIPPALQEFTVEEGVAKLKPASQAALAEFAAEAAEAAQN